MLGEICGCMVFIESKIDLYKVCCSWFYIGSVYFYFYVYFSMELCFLNNIKGDMLFRCL